MHSAKSFDSERIDYSNLPYRDAVGLLIINSNKKIFVGKRVDTKIDAWQMPQGGINPGETPSRAARREMLEEIGTNNATIVTEAKLWYSYNVPKFLIPKLWNGAYRGQRQKWFLMSFDGDDAEINLKTAQPEFYEWRWADPEELLDIIIPFKRKLYAAVLEEFKGWL